MRKWWPFDYNDLPDTLTHDVFCTETGTIKIPCEYPQNKIFTFCIFGPVTKKQLATIHKINKDMVGFTLHYYFEDEKLQISNRQGHLSLLKDLRENDLLK